MPLKIIKNFIMLSICAAVLVAPGIIMSEAHNANGDLHIELHDFLKETEMTFAEYLELMDNYEKNGVHPHYLQQNASRYAAYASRNPHMSMGEVIAYVNVDADIEFYTVIRDVPNPYNVMALVNKHRILPDDWDPTDLVNVIPGRILRQEAAEAYIKMSDDAKENRLNLYIVSSYREYKRQGDTHTNSANWYGLDRADSVLAREGHSEHQAGLALDVLHQAHSGLLKNANFEKTPEYAWLVENAHKYGFILRYADGYKDIHGYEYEPWHWRYIGIEAAQAMFDKGIVVYEEFYGRYLASEVLARVKELVFQEREGVLAAESAATDSAEREAAQLSIPTGSVPAAMRTNTKTDTPAQNNEDVRNAAPAENITEETQPDQAQNEQTDIIIVISAIISTVIIAAAIEFFGVFSLKDGTLISLLGVKQ